MQEIFIPGLKLVEIKTFTDQRGYFRETYRKDLSEDNLGLGIEFVQDNESWSIATGVVRGLHFQLPPHPQAKLVRVAHGAIFDVAIDLRPDSPTFGRWQGFELSAENGLQLFLPVGLAHGFMTLTDDTVINYKVSDYYSPQCDAGLKWDDPDLAIKWPALTNDPIVSDKDAALPFLSQISTIDWRAK